MGKEEGFVQKEPDSLATQAALVSDASYSYVQSISPSTSDGSEVRQKHILFPLAHSDKASLETAFYEMMAVYEGDSYVEESYHTNFDAAYEAYVTRLRFLRREQAQQLADLGIKSQRDASSYIESRSHIPKDTEFLLTMLGRSSVHYKPSLDESRQVLEHPQMLSGAVRSLYENDKAAFSSFVLRSESKLNRYVDSDTMVELLSGLYVDDSSTLISNFSSFKTYFGRENLQPFVDNAVQKVVADIRQLMSAGESTPEQYKQTQEKMYYLLKFLQDEAKVATLAIGTETPLLDASQITAYTLEVLDSIKKVDFLGCTTSLEGLLSEGLVSSEELSAFMLPLLKQGANTENLHMFNYYRDFLTEEVRHELASQAYKLFFEGTSEHLGELDEYAEILTKEQIRAVLYHQLPNLSNLNSYTDLIREYLSVDELSQLFIEGDKIKDRFIGEDIDTLLRLLYREGAVTIDFIEDHIRTTSFHSPKIALLSLLRLPVGLEFKKTTMQELLPEVGVEVQFDLRNTWIPLLYEDVAVQKKVLQDLILRTNNVSFIRTYAARAASNSDSDEVINLLSDSDLKDLFMQNLDLDEGGLDTAVVGTIESLRLLFTREELSTIVMPRLLHNSPLFVVKYYHEMRFSLSPGELAILRQAADSGEIFESVEYLSDILGQEEIQQVVLKHIGRGVKLPTSYDLDRLSKGLGAEFMPKLIQELILVNPVHCVSLYGKSKHFFAPNGVTYDDLIEIARGARYSSLIPNVVEKGFVGIDSPDSLQKLSKLYSRIYAIELVGIASVLAAENESSTSVKSDVNGVNAVQAVAKIATLHPNIFTKYQDLLTSEKYKAGLAQALPDIFEIDPSELPEESIAVQDYESVLALIEYNAKHGKKPEYTSLLRAVALASLSGSSVDIKFGLPDGFEELKDSMLLPANMNREAYTLWQEGADVESEELVADTANELARSIRRTLESEIGHVNDYFVTNFGLEFDGYAESLSDISSHLQELGQAISLASSEYKTAKQLGSDEAALLNDKRLKLVFLRDALKTKELILRVYNLTDSEISQGYVLTEGKKSDSIDNVLKDITGRMSSQPDAARALENLRSQFYKFKTQVYIKQQLHTYITGKPEDIILVGARPVESCQHYLDGGYNEALLAYMVDPNTQVIYVEDTQHTPIARSIIRLLSDSSGNPALHVERVYSSFASVAVRKQVYEAAYRVSEAMGVPLYISTATQRAETGSEVEEIVGFDFSPSSATLQSNNSRGPFVYVDSAGGITTRGRYLLKDLQLVSRL